MTCGSFAIVIRGRPLDSAFSPNSSQMPCRVIDRYWKVLGAEVNARNIYEKDGRRLKPVDEWPEIWRWGLVASVETSVAQDGTRVDKLRLSDRLKRIELIGRHVDVRGLRRARRGDRQGRRGDQLSGRQRHDRRAD